ncbi:MAG: hypothetical protein ACTHQE_17920 [Thermomicrobiales bacterium]
MYALDQLVQRYPGLVSPSRAIRLRQRLSRDGYEVGIVEHLAFDFDMACMWYGKWFDRRAEETVEVNAPKQRKGAPPKMRVPKFKTLGDMLALDAVAMQSPAERQRQADLDAKADALLRDPTAMDAFMADLLAVTPSA